MLKVLELASIVAGPLLRILVGSNRIRFHVACEVLAHLFDWQRNMPDAPLATRDRRPPSGSLDASFPDWSQILWATLAMAFPPAN